MGRHRVHGLAAVIAVTALAAATVARAATGEIEIRDDAIAIQGGEAVLVFVNVTCTLGENEVLLEGNISVSQDDAFGMAGLNPVCDGKTHLLRVRVHTFGGTFDRGDASASAFLLFQNTATNETSQVQDSETITIRGRT